MRPERGYLRDIERLTRMKIDVVAHDLPELTDGAEQARWKSRAAAWSSPWQAAATSRAATSRAASKKKGGSRAALAPHRPRSATARGRIGIAAKRGRAAVRPCDHDQRSYVDGDACPGESGS